MNKVRRFESVIISTILVAGIFSILTSSFIPDASAVSCNPIPHNAITITNNGDFTAANGVISGSGTLADPYIIGNLKIDDLSPGYGLKIHNTSGGITKYFNIQCMQSSFSVLSGGGANLVWLVNINQDTVISDINGNAGEQDDTTGLELDDSSNITLNNLSFNKMGGDGVTINSSDNITITESKLKAENNGLTIETSHDITVGKKCNISGQKGCNEFTYDDGRGVYIHNSHDVIVQYTKTTADDTGGILVDGEDSYNVTLTNGVTSGDGSICEHGLPTGKVVDTVAGIAIVNGAHDVTISHYTANGDSHFSLMNGGDGFYINPCTDIPEPVSTTAAGGSNLVITDVCFQSEFGFTATSSC